MSFKKFMLMGVSVSCLALTGCLEEILASLCNKLASNNSIITVFPSGNTDYSGQYATVTYRNMVTSQELTFNECDNAFAFPNGERKTVTGSGANTISFLSMIDESNESFFMNGGVPNESQNFQVTVTWYNNPCPEEGGLVPAPNESLTSPSALLNFEAPSEAELPPLIDECSITGETAIVVIPPAEPV